MSRKPEHVIHVFPLPDLLGANAKEIDEPSLPDDALELFTPPGFELDTWQADGARLIVCWRRLPEIEDAVVYTRRTPDAEH